MNNTPEKPTGAGEGLDEYTIREYEPEDCERFLSLYEAVWGCEKSREWFRWRFGENPYRETVEMIVVEHDGRLVGGEPLLPFRMRAGDEGVLAYQPVDWIVHPDHRRRGLFTRMTDRLLERYAKEAAFLFNFPTDALLPGLKKFGWRVVGAIPNYFRIQRPSALVDAATREGDVPSLTAPMAGVADPLVRGSLSLCDRLGGGSRDVAVERYRSVPAADLVDVYATGPPDRIHVARDEAFYRWRFSNPDWDTTTYLARRDGDPVASVVVASEVTHGVDRASLLDVQPMRPGPAGTDALEALLEEVVRDHREKDVLKLGDSGLPKGIIRRCGFLRGDTFPLSKLAAPTTLVTRPLSSGDGPMDRIGYRDLTDPEDWLLTLGDQDIE